MDTYSRPGWSGWWLGVVLFGIVLIIWAAYGFVDGWTGNRIMWVLPTAAWVVFCLAQIRLARRKRREVDPGRMLRNAPGDRHEDSS